MMDINVRTKSTLNCVRQLVLKVCWSPCSLPESCNRRKNTYKTFSHAIHELRSIWASLSYCLKPSGWNCCWRLYMKKGPEELAWKKLSKTFTQLCNGFLMCPWEEKKSLRDRYRNWPMGIHFADHVCKIYVIICDGRRLEWDVYMY
jgi:hypothetical protein